jgi:hypothetical protein
LTVDGHELSTGIASREARDESADTASVERPRWEVMIRGDFASISAVAIDLAAGELSD